jgi:hypothetical protein
MKFVYLTILRVFGIIITSISCQFSDRNVELNLFEPEMRQTCPDVEQGRLPYVAILLYITFFWCLFELQSRLCIFALLSGWRGRQS